MKINLNNKISIAFLTIIICFNIITPSSFLFATDSTSNRYDLAYGSITITDGDIASRVSVTYGNNSVAENVEPSITIFQTTTNTIITTNTITIDTSVPLSLTLESVNISSSNSPPMHIKNNSDVNIYLTNSDSIINSFTTADDFAALQLSENARINIRGNGQLNATANGTGAAIGTAGNSSVISNTTLIINSGTINAKSGIGGGAAIGSGANTSNSATINISLFGGFINASVYNSTLASDSAGAAIGSGSGSSNSTTNIDIFGGYIEATASSNGGGAGIGSGNYTVNSAKTSIYINGGTIYANGSLSGGAGIGSGSSSFDKNSIMITSGTIIATGTSSSNSIGNGTNTNNSSVTIDGGNVVMLNNGSYNGNNVAITNYRGELVYKTTFPSSIEQSLSSATITPNYYNLSNVSTARHINSNGNVSYDAYFYLPIGASTLVIDEPSTLVASVTDNSLTSVFDTLNTHELTIVTDGIASYGDGYYHYSESIDVSAGIKDSYSFTEWSSSSDGILTDENRYNPSISFVMPNNSVTLTAHWDVAYTLTVNGITSSDSTLKLSNPADKIVTLVAEERGEDYEFIGWLDESGVGTFNSSTLELSTTYIMPEQDATVTAVWQYIEDVTDTDDNNDDSTDESVATSYIPTFSTSIGGGGTFTPKVADSNEFIMIYPVADADHIVHQVTVTTVSKGEQIPLNKFYDGSFGFTHPDEQVHIYIVYDYDPDNTDNIVRTEHANPATSTLSKSTVVNQLLTFIYELFVR